MSTESVRPEDATPTASTKSTLSSVMGTMKVAGYVAVGGMAFGIITGLAIRTIRTIASE